MSACEDPCPWCARLQIAAVETLGNLHCFLDAEWDEGKTRLLFACLESLMRQALDARCAGCQAEAAVDARLLGQCEP